MIQANKEILKNIIGDKYDLIKFLLTIHKKKIRRDISEDFVLSDLQEKDINFIRDQTKIAFILRDYIQDENIAELLYDQMMSEIYLITILKRNSKNNFLIKKIIESTGAPAETNEDEGEEEGNILTKTKNKLLKKTEEK